MLTMNNWTVTVPLARDRELGFTGEHRARELRIRTDTTGYDCKLELEFEDGQKNILDLRAEDGVLVTEVRREYVARCGQVLAQVRGVRGDTVAKSNPFFLTVRDSVDADAVFEITEPGEFSQLEQRVTEAVTRAEGAALRMPKVRGGTWWIWDAALGDYKDTGEPSSGTPGAPGPQGEKGDAGPALTFDQLTDDQKAALTGPQGPKGDRGETGPQGRSFRVLGYYADAASLAAAVAAPAVGDAYGVGSAAPYDIYIFSGSGWVNNGPIQGPAGPQGETGPRGEKGDKGDTGERGPQGIQGERGPQGVSGAAMTFDQLTDEQKTALTGPEGPVGPTGPRGATGEKGAAGAAGPQGPAGPEGPQGPKGDKGDTPTSMAASAITGTLPLDHGGTGVTSLAALQNLIACLPIAGGTLTGDLRIKGSENYGTKINLGDGDYVHISEPSDDCMEIKAKKINFVVSDTTDSKFTLNGEAIGGGGSEIKVGVYSGNASASSNTEQVISLGGRPRFVFVLDVSSLTPFAVIGSTQEIAFGACAYIGSTSYSCPVSSGKWAMETRASGFAVRNYDSSSAYHWRMNVSGSTYIYMAVM